MNIRIKDTGTKFLFSLISLLLSILLYTIFFCGTFNIFKYIYEIRFSFNEYIHIILLAFVFYNFFACIFFRSFIEAEHAVLSSLWRIISSICQQLKDMKFLLGVIILFFAIYGYQISNFTLSIDEEVQMTQSKNAAQWCYEGRFSIAILKSLFMEFGMYQPYFSTLIYAVIMILSALTICYLFSQKSKNTTGIFSKLIFIAGYLSFPSVIVETVSFSTYCIEVAFGMFLVSFAVVLLDFYYSKKDKIYLIANIICMVFALGIYQAMANVYISIIIIYFLVCIYSEKEFNKERLINYAKYIGFSILIFFISLILFFLIYKIATFIHKQDASIEYIYSFSGWDKKIGFIECLHKSIVKLVHILSMKEIPGIKFFYYFLSLGSLFSIFILMIHRNLKGLICSLLLLMSQCSIFFMWVVLASEYLPFRAWLAAPMVCGFTYFFILYCIKELDWKMILSLAQVIIFIVLCRQIQTLNQLSYSDHIRMQMDVSYAEEIYYDICREFGTPSPETPIVFIGTTDLAKNSTVIQNPPVDRYWGGNSLGYSLWNRAQEPQRMHGLFSTIGYDLTFENCSDTELIEKLQSKLEIFPKENSMIMIDGKIYIRLSENILN